MSEVKKKEYVSDLGETIERPWGTYRTIDESNTFKVKRIEVKPGASLSLQLHHHRNEHWIVVQGVAKVVNGDAITEVKENESIYIPKENKHRLINEGIEKVILIEVQYGDYVGEDDIVRLEDNYGRV